MSDDVQLPGVGTTIATDELTGGRHAQLVKLLVGGDGVGSLASAAAPLPVTAAPLMVSGSASSLTTVIAQTDVSAYSSVTFHISGTYTAQLIPEGSSDGTTWVALAYVAHGSSPINPYATTFTVAGSAPSSNGAAWNLPVTSRYVRLRCNSYTSGTVNVVMVASAAPASMQATYIAGSTSLNVAASGVTTAADGDTNNPWGRVNAYLSGFNGASWDRRRLPRIFRSVTASALGDTAVWTPTSAKRFQLLRFQIFVTGDATTAAGGVLTVALRDATTATGLAVPVYVPTAAKNDLGGWSSGWIDAGDYGYRSAAVNNVLNVNLSTALATGSVGVLACGTEE